MARASDADPAGGVSESALEAQGRALAERVFRPARPRLLECIRALTGAPEAVCRRAVATGRGDPLLFFTQNWETSFGPRSYTQPSGAEGWEAFAPVGWVGDPARAFEVSPEERGEVPPNVRTALALATDPDGVLAAEALAREAVARLNAHGVGTADQVIWRALDPRVFRVGLCRPPARGQLSAGRALFQRLEGGEVSSTLIARAARASAPVRAASARVGTCAEDVADLVEWDLVLRENRVARNPFEPLVALWETGYGVDRVEPGGIVLVAPEVTRATTRT